MKQLREKPTRAGAKTAKNKGSSVFAPRELDGFTQFGVDVSTISDVHRSLLAQWRNSMNLVGPGPLDPHFDDCERATHWLRPEGHWVDLGSGAGFPGLVMADRFPELRLDLVDSRKKRCVFLEQVLGQAGVPATRVQVHCVRVETLTGPYDGVVSRAFAPPPQVLDHAQRLLRPGGTLVLFLQDPAEVPEDPRFESFHVERYRVDGKARQAVGLRLRPEATPAG